MKIIRLFDLASFQLREGAIIECPQNGLFNNLVTVILMSQTAIKEMVDHDQEWPLVVEVEVIKQVAVVNS